MNSPQPTDRFSEAVCIFALAFGWLIILAALVQYLARIVLE